MASYKKIVFLIDKLDRGGAERQLIELVKGLDKKKYRLFVIVLKGTGVLLPELQAIDGINRVLLDRKAGPGILPTLFRLARLIRALKPDLLHSYMGGTNEITLLLGKRFGIPVIWGIRASNMDLSRYSRFARLSFHLSARLSRFTDAMIINSDAGKTYHAEQGYAPSKLTVIENGIDLNRFHPDPEAGRQVRAAWGIPAHIFLIGVVARLDPMKDHTTFLKTVAIVANAQKNVRFVCVGEGTADDLKALKTLSRHWGIAPFIIWAGSRSDMPSVYNALSLTTSCSAFGEGFSNVIAESMACGTPCAVTDVGDSRKIVGSTGKIVPPGNPAQMASAWLYFINLSPKAHALTGIQARQRIREHFPLKNLIDKTMGVFNQIISKKN